MEQIILSRYNSYFYQMFLNAFKALLLATMTLTAAYLLAMNQRGQAFLIGPAQKTIKAFQSTPLYIQHQIQKLSRDRNWSQILSFTDEVLNQVKDYEGSFKFWYHRALSQCYSLNFESCKESWIKASIFAGEKYKSNVDRMQEIFFQNTLIIERQQKQGKQIQDASLI